MRWKENRRVVQDTAGRVRAFRNVGHVRTGPRPEGIAPEYALWWAQRIRQVGTKATGGIRYVEVFYAEPPGGSERFRDGAAVDAMLSAVRRYRTDEWPAEYP
jgi:hypothetical protein